MKSVYIDEFNHDQWAADYDKDVINENNPIRTGYKELLNWVILNAGIGIQSEVLELGSGTGNLTKYIKTCKRIICVDISEEMEILALPKIQHLKCRLFRKSDILEIFEENIGVFDTVISTYTIHHLLEKEKKKLFQEVWKVLRKGGIAVFGDLMFENNLMKNEIIQHFNKIGHKGIAKDIEDEFYWDIETAIRELEEIGFKTEVKKISKLSFGIIAKKI